MRVFVLDETEHPTDGYFKRTEVHEGSFGTLEPAFHSVARTLLELKTPSLPLGKQGVIEVVAGIMEDGQAIFFYIRSHTGEFYNANVYVEPGADYARDGVQKIIAKALAKAEEEVKSYGRAYHRARRSRARLRKLAAA